MVEPRSANQSSTVRGSPLRRPTAVSQTYGCEPASDGGLDGRVRMRARRSACGGRCAGSRGRVRPDLPAIAPRAAREAGAVEGHDAGRVERAVVAQRSGRLHDIADLDVPERAVVDA